MSSLSMESNNNSNSNNNLKCCFGFRLFTAKPDPVVDTDSNSSTVDTEDIAINAIGLANGSTANTINNNHNNKKKNKKNFLSKFQNGKSSAENDTNDDDDHQEVHYQPQPKTLVVTFNKPRVDSYIGLSLKKYKRNNSDILVHSISPNGLLNGSPLKQGQKLVSINYIECPQDLKSTIDLLKTAPAGPMRIEVVVQQE